VLGSDSSGLLELQLPVGWHHVRVVHRQGGLVHGHLRRVPMVAVRAATLPRLVLLMLLHLVLVSWLLLLMLAWSRRSAIVMLLVLILCHSFTAHASLEGHRLPRARLLGVGERRVGLRAGIRLLVEIVVVRQVVLLEIVEGIHVRVGQREVINILGVLE